jgi:hypothetical protein
VNTARSPARLDSTVGSTNGTPSGAGAVTHPASRTRE